MTPIATVWYLVMVLYGGDHYSGTVLPIQVVRFPTTSSSACNAALTAARFPPVAGTMSGWNYQTGMLAFCLPGGGEITTAYPPPVAVPPP